MGDVLTKEQRSYNMSRIRGSNTAPEVALRRALRDLGLRGYRIKSPLPGKPDIVFLKSKIAVFVDGCFWHKCPKCFRAPETRKDFWKTKIETNVERDKNINGLLYSMGWKVLRLWEHEIKEDSHKVAMEIQDKVANSGD